MSFGRWNWNKGVSGEPFGGLPKILKSASTLVVDGDVRIILCENFAAPIFLFSSVPCNVYESASDFSESILIVSSCLKYRHTNDIFVPLKSAEPFGSMSIAP